MRTEYEYHGIIRKIVAMFGDIFNEINVARKDNDGNLVNQRRVPLAYAPRESFWHVLTKDLTSKTSVWRYHCLVCHLRSLDR